VPTDVLEALSFASCLRKSGRHGTAFAGYLYYSGALTGNHGILQHLTWH